MNDRLDFEARLEGAFAAYADRAPVEVDPISMTATVAHGRPRRARLVLALTKVFNVRASRLAAATVLALLVIGAAIVAGAYVLRSHHAIGGGGLMLIVQADQPQSGQQPTTEQVFTFDQATGDRQPIVGWTTRYPYGMWAMWSPDRKHAMLEGYETVTDIVDVASHQLSPILLAPDEMYVPTERFSWARGSDRVASIVLNKTNTRRSILIYDLAGGKIVRLPLPLGWDAGHPTWSPDGLSLVLDACQDPCATAVKNQLLLVPIDGSPTRVLLDDPAPRLGVGPAIWSPDGSTIAFETGYGIQTLDVATGRQASVTQGFDREPAWSPDGRRLAFARHDGLRESASIYVVDVDGGHLRQLTNDTTERSEGLPAWSPDGTILTFTRDRDLWVVGADGAAPHLLFKNASADW